MSSDLISREEALSHPFANGKYDKENANLDYILGFESYKEWLETLPIVDIMECARAIKDYCDKTRCEECELAEHKVMNDTDNYLCRVHYLRPECWDLPEGEKE